MRILHAVRSDGFSGVERHIVDLARAQAEAGKQVVVVGGDPASMTASLAGVAVPHRPATTLLDTWTEVQRLAGAVDLVHAHMTAAEVASMAVPAAWTKPLVSTRHFAEPRGQRWFSPSRAVRPLLNARITAQIAVSDYAASLVDGPTTVVHAGVPCHPDVNSDARAPIVLVAQRLEPEKRTEVALAAFATSGLARRGWQLHIAGDGSSRAELQSAAHRWGVAAATRFLGHVRDMDALLQQAGILVATRPDEAYGLSVLEAMAWGMPVVAAGAAGHLETVGTVPGARLFTPGDHGDAGRLLAALADDPGARSSYGAALRAAQRERFTMAAQERATDAVYRSVL